MKIRLCDSNYYLSRRENVLHLWGKGGPILEIVLPPGEEDKVFMSEGPMLYIFLNSDEAIGKLPDIPQPDAQEPPSQAE